MDLPFISGLRISSPDNSPDISPEIHHEEIHSPEFFPSYKIKVPK